MKVKGKIVQTQWKLAICLYWWVSHYKH